MGRHLINWKKHPEFRRELYRAIVHKFIPYHEWECESRPSRKDREKYDLFIEDMTRYFASKSRITPTPTKEELKNSLSVQQQIDWATTKQKPKMTKYQTKTYLLNIAAAIEEGFISNVLCQVQLKELDR